MKVAVAADAMAVARTMDMIRISVIFEIPDQVGDDFCFSMMIPVKSGMKTCVIAGLTGNLNIVLLQLSIQCGSADAERLRHHGQIASKTGHGRTDCLFLCLLKRVGA